MAFNSIKSISSRYSTQNINTSYSTLTLSGGTSTIPIATFSYGGATSAGLIFSPYIPIDSNSEWYKEMLRNQQRELRKEKLNNLNNIFLSEE